MGPSGSGEVNAAELLRRNRLAARKARVNVLGTDWRNEGKGQLAPGATITSEFYLQTFNLVAGA